MTKEEKFKALVSNEKTDTLAKNKERIKNRNRLRESQAIAMKVLDKLDEPGWSQVRLAKEMKVSPQQITKIVSGKENLTLETIVKLQEILNIPILASYLEKHIEIRQPLVTILEELRIQRAYLHTFHKLRIVPQITAKTCWQNNVLYNPKEVSYQNYEKEEIWHMNL